MFAARANNENAIYEQQTAAAAKPLNQGVKGLAPKTPANKAPKTPFKVPLNDENATFGGLKTGGKAKQDGLFGEGKSGKVDRSAFVTPAGPRNRAPLGNKTTNAKATAFQTPAPQTQERPSAKQTSPRMRRAKIKIHEAEAITIEDGEEEREIEYMPPREVPLPDYPEDWPHDRIYPQFEGNNLTRGWRSEFIPQKDDQDDDEFSDFEEKLKRIEELNEKKKQQALQAKKAAAMKKGSLAKTTKDPLTAKPPQVLSMRNAASALSSSTKLGLTSSISNAKTRAPSTLASKKSVSSTIPTGNSRHTAAKVASNSTLGYSKGRAVSATGRKPLSALHKESFAGVNANPTETNAQPSGAMTLDELFGLQDSSLGEGDDDALYGSATNGLTGLDDEEDEFEAFQLEVVDL